MRIFDLKALGQEMNLSVRTLRRYVREKGLEATLVGRSYYVTEEDLLRFLKDTKE